MIQYGSIPTSNDMAGKLDELRQESDLAHREIERYFSESNNLYNISSVTEDIILGQYLSLLNTAKSIEAPGIGNKGLIIESFTSEDYIDKNFPLDSKLNIDMQNGDLTLPIKATVSLKASTIILENDNNGSMGNAFAGGKNSDINVILQSNASSYFEYEKISSSFNTDSLYLGFAIKLEKEEIANCAYIKLFVSDEMLYPKLDIVEISLDGINWTEITREVYFNKADHYIRFLPKKIRYIRFKLSQDVFSAIKTSFGNKNRYLIGIREVSIKRVEYKDSGEYVSVPLSGRKMQSIEFSSSEISNNDISYLVSASNGTKWQKIEKNTKINLLNQDFGLREETKIDSIRIKININKQQSPASTKMIEYLSPNLDNKYFLQNNPLESKVYLGNHISYGELVDYKLILEDASSISEDMVQVPYCLNDTGRRSYSILYYIAYSDTILDEIILKVNGMPVKNDRNIYTILKHTDPKHSILIFTSSAMPTGSFSISYKPFIYDHRYNMSPTIKLPNPSFYNTPSGFLVKAIKYEELGNLAGSANDGEISNALNLEIGDVWISSEKDISKGTWWATLSNQSNTYFNVSQYTITPFNIGTELLPDYSESPRSWILEGSNSDDDSEWMLLDTQNLTELAFSDGQARSFMFENSCLFKKYRLNITNNIADTNILAISSISFSANQEEKLEADSGFIVVDTNTIEINKDKYNRSWDYKISYYPSVDISSFKNIDINDILKNVIYLNGIYGLPLSSKISFNYNYQDNTANSLLRYYTPICNEYRIYIP